MAHPHWLCACAIVFLMAGQMARADDKSTIPDGYKAVRLPSGETILVKKDPDPVQQDSPSASTDRHDPSQYDLSRTSSFANKTFVTGPAMLPQKDSTPGQGSFMVKPYAMPTESEHTMPNLNAKFPTSASNAYSRNATGLDKSYFVPDSNNPVGNQTALFAASTSSFQGRTALFNAQPEKTFTSPMSGKPYLGELPVIPRETGKISATDLQMHLKDLPDRPLTIDEVRALIDHGVEPDLTAKPAPPSKSLDDPNYQPDPLPAPPDTSAPAPAPTSEDDKNDPVPSPGTMAQPPPENTEPLPQH